jgi:hypothetical protein
VQRISEKNLEGSFEVVMFGEMFWENVFLDRTRRQEKFKRIFGRIFGSREKVGEIIVGGILSRPIERLCSCLLGKGEIDSEKEREQFLPLPRRER